MKDRGALGLHTGRLLLTGTGVAGHLGLHDAPLDELARISACILLLVATRKAVLCRAPASGWRDFTFR